METMIFLAIPAIILVWAIVTYNRFIALRRMMEEAWSGVAVQLKRRHDQIPNLIETVKGYAGHEQKLLLDLGNMRGMSFGTRPTSTDMVRSEEELGSALGKLFALAEAYPTLKANENFLSLQQALGEIEEQLQLARRYFNGTVRRYNILTESFPSLLIAKLFSFTPATFFELDNQAEAAVPKVGF